MFKTIYTRHNDCVLWINDFLGTCDWHDEREIQADRNELPYVDRAICFFNDPDVKHQYMVYRFNSSSQRPCPNNDERIFNVALPGIELPTFYQMF